MPCLNTAIFPQQEYDEALSQKLEVCENSTISTNYEMLSFVEYSIYDAITQLLKVNNLKTPRKIAAKWISSYAKTVTAFIPPLTPNSKGSRKRGI